MAVYISTSDINIGDAWNLIDSTSFLDAENTSEQTSTGGANSSTFTPGAIVVWGLVIKFLSVTTSGSTFTASIQQGGVDVSGTSVTISGTSIPSAGGWVVLKFSSPVTLAAATAYTINFKSSVASAFSVYRNATVSNLSRALITTTAAFPTTNDQLIIAGYYTGTGGAGSDVTVTLNQTGTPIQFGTTSLTQSISIASRGTLALANTAGTAYTMKHRGICQVRGGTLQLGTSGSRLDSTSSLTWTADSVATADSGWNFYSGTVNIYGANNKAKWTTLEASVTSGASKQLTVASTTGFAVGDTVYLTTTNSSTRTQVDTTTISSIDSATTMTVASLSFAHTGTNNSNGDYRCRVVNCTRNITLQGNSVSLGGYIDHNTSSVVNMSYVALWYMGSTASTTGKRGFDIRHGSSGSTNLQYCVSYVTGTTNGRAFFLVPSANTASITIQHCTSVISGDSAIILSTMGASATTIEYCLFAGNTSGSTINFVGANQIIRNNEIIGCQTAGNNGGMYTTADNTNALPITGDLSGNYIAFCGYAFLLNNTLSSRAFNMNSINIVECTSGIYLGVGQNYCTKERQVFNNWTVYGGGGILPPITILGSGSFDFIGCTFTKGTGTWVRLLYISGGNNIDMRFINCTVNNGSLADLVTLNSFLFNGQIKFINCTGLLSAPTGLLTSTNIAFPFEDCVISSHKHNGTNDLHMAAIKQGWVETDTTIKDTGKTRSVKLTPNHPSVKTGTPMIWRISVTGGSAITVNVKWRKSVVGDGAAYNGNQPRLIIKRNDAIGISSDTVLATATNAANGTWETIGGTSATFTDEGEACVYVDCDGNVGWINIQEISVGSSTNDMTYWNGGLPVQYLEPAAGSSGSAFSYASS